MKNICKFFLALGVYSTVFSQIPEIKRLPVQDISQSIQESAPVWLSESEILIFYVNETKDTIFSTRSTNRGLSWNVSIPIQQINLLTNQDEIYLSALKLNSDRMLLTWSIRTESMKLIYSDDSGISWSQPINILGGGPHPVYEKNSEYLNLSQWEDGTSCLSFIAGNHGGYYRLSYDDGLTWSSNVFQFPNIPTALNKYLTIISVGTDSLLGIYETHTLNNNEIDIVSRFSSDAGVTWFSPEPISAEVYHTTRPKISKLANGNVIVAYQRDNVSASQNFGELNLYYKISSDNGSTWSDEFQITKYVGDDLSHSIATFENKTFFTFSTERYYVQGTVVPDYQIAYGIIQESEDKFTPPKVYNAYAPQELRDYENKTFVYRLTIIDDEKVKSGIVMLEDSAFIAEVYDDGMHEDGEANDSIFANTFPLINPRYINNYLFEVNKVKLPLNASGVLADVNVTYGQKTSVISSDIDNNKSLFKRDLSLGSEGSGGRYDEVTFLFSSGFFLSGYNNGTLFANGVASASLVLDYLAGPVGSNADDPLNQLYSVKKNDLPFGNSWQNWKNAVLLGADFYDGDNDGKYNPVDKNFNGTWDMTEDMPPLIGDEIVWCIYNDGLPKDVRRYDVDPIGIEIQQTLFASSEPQLENVIFLKYKITNTGLVSEQLDSIFFSPWDDTDLGDATDDLGGCDTLLQSLFTFNAFDDYVYGNNPPAIFTTLLQGPSIHSPADTAFIRNGEIIGSQIFPGFKNLGLYSFTGYAKSVVTQSDPFNVEHVWNYVHARDRNGDLLNPCDTIFGKVYGGVNCNDVNPMYWFSGDPVIQNGWLDARAMDDRKFSSTGPISLKKDKPVEIILALVVGRGSDYLNSITVARENVQRAIAEYESNFATMTYSPPAATNPVNSYVLYQNYPNPFNPVTTIRYELPQDGQVTIDMFDILGQRVTTLVDEYKKADRYEIRFNSTGLASGVYIYQLRVNDFITSKKMVLVR